MTGLRAEPLQQNNYKLRWNLQLNELTRWPSLNLLVSTSNEYNLKHCQQDSLPVDIFKGCVPDSYQVGMLPRLKSFDSPRFAKNEPFFDESF